MKGLFAKAKAWMSAHKKLVKYILIGLAALFLIHIIGSAWNCHERADARRLKASETKVQTLDVEISGLKGQMKQQQESKAKLLKEIQESDKIIDGYELTPPTKIKTIMVEKVEYVTKVEYMTLREKCQFTLDQRAKYKEYIAEDQPFEVNLNNLFTKLEEKNKELGKQIDIQAGTINDLKSKSKRGFAAGPYFGIDHEKKPSAGLAVIFEVIKIKRFAIGPYAGIDYNKKFSWGAAVIFEIIRIPIL